MRAVSQKKGDTLIEVMFAITVFALIAVISVNLMNSGVYTAQKSLEVTMARNELDAQSEALRFIHNSYLSEKEASDESKQFSKLWDALTDSRLAQMPQNIDYSGVFNINGMNSCEDAYKNPDGQVFAYKSFVLNTRLIQPDRAETVALNGVPSYDVLVDNMVMKAVDNVNMFTEAALYPRIIFQPWGSGAVLSQNDNLLEMGDYRKITKSEGVWVISVRGGTNADSINLEPEYYDFYVRTCWHSIGRSVPSTIGSIVRLYNPEVVE